MKRSGFTMIELIFVIVIIGILAATAIPKFTELQINSHVGNVVKAYGSLVENGASSLLNEKELNENDITTMTIDAILKVNGKEWTNNAGDLEYTFDDGEGADCVVTFSLNGTNREATITLTECSATATAKINAKTATPIDLDWES